MIEDIEIGGGYEYPKPQELYHGEVWYEVQRADRHNLDYPISEIVAALEQCGIETVYQKAHGNGLEFTTRGKIPDSNSKTLLDLLSLYGVHVLEQFEPTAWDVLDRKQKEQTNTT